MATTLRHPDVADDLVVLDPARARLLQRQGWEPVAAKPTKPATVGVILADVGNDPALAATALADEQAQDKPRKSLVDALTTIVGAAGTED